MKEGLPNSLRLPNSCQKPSQVFWQCPFSFALPFGQHMRVAHGWTGVEFVWLLAQDGAGGLELTGNAFQVKEKDKWTMEFKPRQKQFKVRRHVH